jgi:hypothetical protein
MTANERKAKQRREAAKAGLCPICALRKPSPRGYKTCRECRELVYASRTATPPSKASLAKPATKGSRTKK